MLSDSSSVPTASIAGYNGSNEPSSPEDENTLHRNMEFNMKTLVGDTVGNMSISPSGRDVVLATRRGLYIIDCEVPDEVPRFLAQGGTWDVADVQWNPHPVRAEYIVSTSSEKMLIWNLMQSGPTSIQHILQFHYRAITDINWHTSEPDVVVSTGIDSWLWAWDLRSPSHKAVLGFSAFGAGGTQVKWNRQDPNILASSHMNEVLIWDRRKGSLPLFSINAHSAKIYGIDWSHSCRRELVTCSLDKTIKVWDMHLPDGDGERVATGMWTGERRGDVGWGRAEEESAPRMVIHPGYPVWRARDLPFGKGIMSLPQRGKTALQMWSHDDTSEPVTEFSGHADVVKEFVWRRGSQQDVYQMITWSKDRTLRFWPVESDVMESVGHVQGSSPPSRHPVRWKGQTHSYRDPPEESGAAPVVSAPVGGMGILDQVRAGRPKGTVQPSPRSKAKGSPTGRTFKGSPTHVRAGSQKHARWDDTSAGAITIAQRKGPTMSRGNFGGRSVQIERTSWFVNVKRVEAREGSSGPESGSASRRTSMSRRGSGDLDVEAERRSGSREEDGKEAKEFDANQALHDEITAVVTKLKVKFDQPEKPKKRSFTFGLHGPWGESGSVFIRVTFTFPKGYPMAVHPEGTPTVDIERHPLVSSKKRSYMLRRVRRIVEQQRPCLEACLRFLLYADTKEPRSMSRSDSSSDEDDMPSRRQRDVTATLMRQVKNVAEPRTSQGTFSVGGHFVCFFRGMPRIVQKPETPQMFQSPALLSDAVRRLTFAATDRTPTRQSRTRENKSAEENEHRVLRIMTNLLTTPQHAPRRLSETRPHSSNYSWVNSRASPIHVRDLSDITGLDRAVAKEYGFGDTTCGKNAEVAARNGRFDHERIFKMVEVVLTGPKTKDRPRAMMNASVSTVLLALYRDVLQAKDVQILAMLASILLPLFGSCITEPPVPKPPIISPSIHVRTPSVGDYFSIRRRKDSRPNQQRLSPYWPSPTLTPTPSSAPPLSSTVSSLGSWSSIFNAGSMKQLVAGVQSHHEGSDGAQTPSAIPVPGGGGHVRRGSESPMTPGRTKSDSPVVFPSPAKSWSDARSRTSAATSSAISSGPMHKRTFSQVVGRPHRREKRIRADVPQGGLSIYRATDPPVNSHPAMLDQLMAHVLAYADILFTWQILEKRAELLKSVGHVMKMTSNGNAAAESAQSQTLGISLRCPRCQREGRAKTSCAFCGFRIPSAPSCSVCQLPVKGLSNNCARCLHVAHIRCWREQAPRARVCPTGCGCACAGLGPPPSTASPATFISHTPRSSTSLSSHA